MHSDNVLALFDVNGFYNTQSKKGCINLWDKRFFPLSKRWRAQQVTHAYQASRSPTLSSFTPRARHRIAEKRKKTKLVPLKKSDERIYLYKVSVCHSIHHLLDKTFFDFQRLNTVFSCK